ncbi:MAG: hypothetical protein FIB06_03250 [Betaproteobacteria bacterium]|nr:hypothetical protein [Betaproteobacteria bacterium]
MRWQLAAALGLSLSLHVVAVAVFLPAGVTGSALPWHSPVLEVIALPDSVQSAGVAAPSGLEEAKVPRPAEPVASSQGLPVRGNASGDDAMAAGLRYFKAQDLDQKPVPVDVPRLDSEGMLGTREREVVEIRLWINPAGGVDRVALIAGNEPFAATVLEAFRSARFTPGQIAGQPVPSEMALAVEYPAIR